MSNRIPSNSPDYNSSGAVGILDAAFAVQYVNAASAAIANKEGEVFVTYAGVAAMTLAQPVAGLQSAGGDDGRKLQIIDTGGHAHTVTCATNGILPSHHLATFGGTAGQFLNLIAWNGVWIPSATSGVTVS